MKAGINLPLFWFAFDEGKNGTNHESVIIYYYVVYKYHFD